MRKRDIKLIKKDAIIEQDNLENQLEQGQLPEPPLRGLSPIVVRVAKEPEVLDKHLTIINKIVEKQNEKIQKLEELVMRQQALIANQSTPCFSSQVEGLVDQILIKSGDLQFHQQQWQDEDFQVRQDYQIQADYFVDQSQPTHYDIPKSSMINCEQESQSSAAQEEVKEPKLSYKVDIISQEQVDKVITEYQSKFKKLRLSKKDLIQLVSHPVTLTQQNMKPVNIKAEEYYLLNDTIEAFLKLIRKQPFNSKKTINLCSHKTFASMMNNYKTDEIFKIMAPAIEDDDQLFILPYYSDRKAHWCFILVDLGHEEGKPKVYMVDSVECYQKQHRRALLSNDKVPSQAASWSNAIMKWVALSFEGEKKYCTFEVLNIKNQDNNYDCGLLLCLLIWQFYKTKDVNDLVAFPWHANFSQHYRLAVARALGSQSLTYIEEVVKAKRLELTFLV